MRRRAALLLLLATPAVARAQSVTPNATPDATLLPDVNVVGSTPVLGTSVERDKVPVETNVITPQDITREGNPDALRALEENVAGVSLDDASGNRFQPSLFYHGFQASPLQGNAQGLAVYLNGVRFNQPFGDTVNWDLIPSNAIDRMDLEDTNPVFGLNALGGSLAVQMKNGFTFHGGDAEMYGGSFGRVGGDFEYGKQTGNTSVYIAGSKLYQDGWRNDNSSRLGQLYGDIGWRGERAEIHLNIDAADNYLNGPGTVPVQLLDVNRAAIFTSPNSMQNQYLLSSLNGNFDVTDTTSVQAIGYYENFLQSVVNGNSPNFSACGAFVCQSPGMLGFTPSGAPIPNYLNGGPYSQLNIQTTNTNAYGGSLQMTNTDKLFGFNNQFVLGASYDGGLSQFTGNTILGGLTPVGRFFTGPGYTIDQPDGSIVPVRLTDTTDYYGIFFTDVLDITKRLSATIGGRFNAAQINLQDMIGTALNGNHTYNHFNPEIGLTYKVTPHVTASASYAEGNRAPTPAELSCASPQSPCSLANFFVGDPNLKQVVSHTYEAGLSGHFTPYGNANLTWSVDAYRADNTDDILFVQSPLAGLAYFQNVGNTQRQGFDLTLRLTDGKLLVWGGYSYINATFQNALTLSSPDNPLADANGNIHVKPGDQLPGIPPNSLKLGANYNITDAWLIGAVGIAASGQYLFGDEANLTPNTGAYFELNLNTSYQVTKNIQLYALLENAFNASYYTYGTFSPTSSVPIREVPGASNTRSLSPAQPIAAFGGMRVAF